MLVEIPVSVGELIDKITILEIKSGHIWDERREWIVKELGELRAKAPDTPLIHKLRYWNGRLWVLEEILRYCPNAIKKHSIATLIAEANNERAGWKARIDNEFNSEIREVKSYGLG